jgi:hypothetical protein
MKALRRYAFRAIVACVIGSIGMNFVNSVAARTGSFESRPGRRRAGGVTSRHDEPGAQTRTRSINYSSSKQRR